MSSCFQELSQRQVSNSFLIALSQKRGGADDVLGMVVANLLQRSKLTVAGGLLRDYIARLYVNSLARLGDLLPVDVVTRYHIQQVSFGIESDEVVQERDVADIVSLNDILEHNGVEHTGEIGPYLLVAVKSHLPESWKTAVVQSA